MNNKSTLLQFNEQWKQYESEGFLLPGATTEDIDRLTALSVSRFGQAPSQQYLDLLRFTNGFSMDGLTIYGATEYQEDYFIDGFIEANTAFWEEPSLQQYLAYGSDNSVRLVFNLTSRRYQIVDLVVWDAIKSFETFDEMLSTALGGHSL